MSQRSHYSTPDHSPTGNALRVVVIANNPIPYHTPILNALSRLLPMHVVYMSRYHPLDRFDDTWGENPVFPYSYYHSLRIKRHASDFRMQASIGVSWLLRRLDPDVILFSSWGPLVWEPVVWKCLSNRRAVMWGESTASSGLHRHGPSRRLRSLVVSNVDAFVTNGTLASEYLETLGASRSSIVTSRLPSVLRPAVTPRREGHSSPRYLYVGRLIPIKRPLELLDAFEDACRFISDATLTIVGDGPLIDAVRNKAAESGGRVTLMGRLEGRSLSKAYSASDVLILPSEREVWGLVVNEALAHGLYVIASDQVGSAHDLVDGRSGAVYPTCDNQALSRAIVDAAEQIGDSGDAEARAARVADVTADRFAVDICAAVTLAHSLT